MRGALVRGTNLLPGHYRCTRCGIERSFNHVRKPAMCADCKSVERLMAAEVAA